MAELIPVSRMSEDSAAPIRDAKATAPMTAVSEKFNARPAIVAQRAAADRLSAARPPNRTGLPDRLKAGVEALSGVSLDDVRVHRNSPEPAQMQAHAFAQGTDIHLAPGQDHHLPHEAWHVVQQKQGRVRATRQLKGGVAINDDAGLEHEADVMGAAAARHAGGATEARPTATIVRRAIQRATDPAPPKRLAELDGIIDHLADIAQDAIATGNAAGAPLLARVATLRDTARTASGEEQAALVAALHKEMGLADKAPVTTPPAGHPVQRTPLEIAVSVAIGLATIGLGALIIRARATRAAQARADAAMDRYSSGALGAQEISESPIAPELETGLAGLAKPAAAARLFQNVNRFPFHYTGDRINPRAGFAVRRGDCGTLVGMYQLVANAHHINFVLGSEDRLMLVPARALHGRPEHFNTHDTRFWFFQEHYWAIAEGTPYDLLFMASPPPVPLITTGSHVYNGITYHTFPGHWLVEPHARFGADVTHKGRVFDSLAAVQAFIDEHR